MSHRIWSALQRTFDRLLTLLMPATGRHRQGTQRTAPAPRTASGLRLLVRNTAPLHLTAPWPRPRARGRDDQPVLDPAGPLVRPYLRAHEQRARRLALALALDGIDIGPRVIHGHLVGTPVTGVAA
ncbi:hypothetical protein GCM10020367_34320 [Streptomyces sannanensis]|uniref:Uncharacterized protein n=1 Tax=Streptomyces sannanensis TaxID=285536 RepID=A0ABP6SCU1_9ACTN